MSDIPTPRSYQQILSEMLDAALRRVPFEGFRIGGPLLSLLEAAAQSDVKSTQDIFSLLDSISVDRANGVALDRIGIDEGLNRLAASAASGKVTVVDSSFTKKATTLFSGTADVNPGSVTIYVADASSFPATGSIYIGRGTNNYEGPLAYTTVTSLGNYWQIDLSSGTARFHGKNESVILAQGGNRTVAAGTAIKGNDTNSGTSVSFLTTDISVIADGETTSSDILVVAEKPGIAGNVGANSIVKFNSPPFTGATVTNPLPFVNGTEIESDIAFRERIRNARKAKTKGTALAIKEAILGLTAPDEDARVASASIVIRKDAPAQLFIDNGLGYEPTSASVSYEVIVDSALGGERDFQLLGNRPIFKAFVRTLNSAPFALVDGCTLAVKVGGLTYEHTFPAEDFRVIGAATAYEVAASINANTDLPFTARTTSNSQQIALVSKDNANEDIEITTVSAGLDANNYLNFPIGKIETLKLFKNGRLLNKDGRTATITTAPQSDWSISIANSETLIVNVDGTGNVTYTITDSDFVDNNTGYPTVSSTNSLQAWAKVFNKKVVGITANVVGPSITLTSNRGASLDASVVVSSSSTLVTKGMFTSGSLSATGTTSDYTFNRNLGQGQLAVALDVGDQLTAGTQLNSGFVQTGPYVSGAPSIAVNNKFWLSVDGDATIVETDVTASTSITVSAQTPTYDALVLSFARYTATAGVFSNLLAGDYVIVWDSALTNKGFWRVSKVDPAGAYFEVARLTVTPQTTTLAEMGMAFVRTAKPIQQVTISASTYNTDTLAAALNDVLQGSTAKTVNNNAIRIYTNTVDQYGEILIPSVNSSASGFEFGTDLGPVANESKSVASVETTHTDFDMPNFYATHLTSVASGNEFSDGGARALSILGWIRPWEDGTVSRYGNNHGSRSYTESFSPYSIVVRSETFNTDLMNQDRYYEAVPYSLSYDDSLSVTVDSDTNFTVPMYRNLFPKTSAIYGTSFDVEDADNNLATLDTAFGADFNFNDFAVMMRARIKTHGTSGASKAILWRYGRYGKDGEGVTIAYENPAAPSSSLALEVWDATTARTSPTGGPHVAIILPSGAARTGLNLSANARLSVAFTTALGIDTITYSAASASVNAPTLISAAGNAITDNGATFTVNTGVAHSLTTGDYVSLTGWGVAGYNGGWVVASTPTGNTFTVSYAGGLGNDAGPGNIYKAYAIRSIIAPSTVMVKTAANHGLTAGNYVWMTWGSPDANFPNGAKVVVSVTPDSFTYAESGAFAGNAYAGTVGYSATLPDFTNVVVNDIVNITNGGNSGGIDDANCGIFRVTAKTATSFTVKRLTGTAVAAGALPLLNTDYLTFYPLDTSATTANDIVAFTGTINRDVIYSAQVVQDGGGTPGVGTINKSSIDEYIDGGTSYYHTFDDGYNQVSSLVFGATSTLTLKVPPNSTLTADADFANEEIRLVPITTNNIVDWLNSSAVTSLSQYADIKRSYSGFKSRISHKNPGTSSTLKVNGGKANSASTSLIGTANETGKFVTVDSDTAAGLAGGSWAIIANQAPEIKKLFIDGNSIQMTAAGSVVTLQATGATLWDIKWTCPNSVVWKFEKHGRYACMTVPFPVSVSPNLSGASPAIKEGDYIKISSSLGNISSVNLGWFKVEKYDTSTHSIWFVNDNLLEEQITLNTYNDEISIYDADLVIPGDTFTIPDATLGTNNQGTWEVTSLGVTQTSVYLRIPDGSTNPNTALGANAESFYFSSGENLSLVKKITNIAKELNTNNHRVYIADSDRLGQFSSSKNATIAIAHKLNFPTTTQTGIDAYAYGTGLVAECAKVVYGDEKNPSMYPGVAAAGAEIDIEGPVIRRLSVALSVRIKTNLDIESVVSAIKSAVATEINTTPVGTNIPISNIIAAASRVNGAHSIVVISPIYGTGNDIIEVKAFEKPLILDIDSDITVEVIGT